MTISRAVLNYDLRKAINTNRLKGLWGFMAGFRTSYLGATLCLAVAATAKTGTFMLLRYFIDQYLGAGERTFSLLIIGLGFILLAGVEGGFSFLSGRLAARTAEGVVRRLRNYLFDHIQHLSFTYHSQTETGELIQRCTSDVDTIRRFYAEQAIGIGRIILLFVINFFGIYLLSPRLAWISVVVIPVLLVVSSVYFRRIYLAYEDYQKQDAILSTTLQENLSGIRVVKAFARQEYEMDKFEKDNWEKFMRGKKLLRMQSTFWPVTDTICNIQIVLGFLVAALMAIQGEISIGTYLAYVGLVVWIIFPMRNLGRLIVQTSTGMVSFTRVMDIIKVDREPLETGDYRPTVNMTGKFEFKHMGFKYNEGNVALEDISFECQPGQSIALLGSTGSGKTTLVNLLPRFYDYTSGSILLDGVELKRYPKLYLRQQIGIVEQEPFLFSRSIRENITYGVGRNVSEDEIVAAAKAASVHDVILGFGKGYDTLVGERGVTLSGGQKQRITIARTLLKDPRILILDNSTSSVDTETEADIREALQGLMKGRSTFIIAHRIQSIMNADLILVLDKGRIVQSGKHDDLVKVEGIYRQIFDIQTRIEDELDKEIASVS